MRSSPAGFHLVSPQTLSEALGLLAGDPGAWTPIAGGTDVMVLYAAGKLPARGLISLHNLHDLRAIRSSAGELQIGAACSYTAIRCHEIVQREFPLLAGAASWTGGIANQNRGTLGGNIANASPAADSLPALLVYGAELILVSVRGERRLPYRGFHTGYKKMLLEPDELIHSIILPRRFAGYFPYSRKVGARQAQAVSKVCIAAVAKSNQGVIEDVRIALASVAPVPLRLTKTEALLAGKPLGASLADLARNSAISEISPIDDIRSTARYRSAVVGNLVAEFIAQLSSAPAELNPVLAGWNALPRREASQQILPCCGSRVWAVNLAVARPLLHESALLDASDRVWQSLAADDWLEAFRSHPRIGESRPETATGARSSAWSVQEQRQVATSAGGLRLALAEANRLYEQRYGRIFIVCATGKSAAEILEILRRRLQNDDATELRVAAEEQRQIIRIRLKKWLAFPGGSNS